jgi:hypothetical protein
VECARAFCDLGDGRDGHGPHPRAGMAHHVADVVAIVDLGLEDDDALARNLGAPQAADQLLALTAEHGAADDLQPAASPRWDPEHGRGAY